MTSVLLSVTIIFICFLGDSLAKPGYSASVDYFDTSLASGCSPLANLCNNTANYPYEQIRVALKKFPGYHTYFGTIMSIPKRRDRRQLDENTGSDICQTKISKMLPRVGINTNKEVLTIVNTGDWKQEVPYVECLNGKCKPMEKVVELVVLNKDGDLARDKFSVPFTCRMHSVTS
ncbi:hypothetical protein AMK59_5784 [Oryctes borbonicus]|uniref:Spaetzle domain-containing protein n=1 Tax=Oryctes borbonicus TaxID=1629725 RepID=A0A0T6B2E8_9SCAR|nr:hypothetical protein AMK59_5784 [Oryctes borbonicus]